MYPRSRRPCRKAPRKGASSSSLPACQRIPILGVLPRCAPACRGHAIAAPPRSAMNSRLLIRYFPDELRNSVDDSRRRGSREATGGLRGASGVPAVRMTSDPAIWLASRRTPSVVMTHPHLQLLRWGRSWSQSVDQPQDFLKQFLRHRDLGHLEDDVAAMAYDLGADLHEFFPQARQRPLLDRLRQSQRPHEVGEIVGQRMKLKPDGVAGERAA